MTQEGKDLLLKDLCARLPYHVRVKVWLEHGDTEEGPLDLQHNYGDVLRDAFYYKKIKKIKPYLRPLSSMTVEEEVEWFESVVPTMDCDKQLDFYCKYHFDYRGLIEMGLGIDCTGLNIYENEKSI